MNWLEELKKKERKKRKEKKRKEKKPFYCLTKFEIFIRV